MAGASKHGVTGLAPAFAHELAKGNIRVNSVQPTGVDTPMGTRDASDAIQRGNEANPRVGLMFTNSIPVDVIAPIDISNAVLFLASDEPRHVTATALTVDAGNSQF
jgi:NAD(P)-dependent dehydrogenase (short-subunit alcohol dehydrogenase family)